MRFGLGPFAAEAVGKVGATEAYEIISDAVVLAENLGFDSAWTAERYFTRDGYCPSAFVAASALAARTDAIRLGVLPILGLSHPLYLAEDAATFDNLAAGRAIIAPINAVAHEIAGYEVDAGEYADRFQESLDVLFSAWSARPFHHQGATWTIPAQLDGHTENTTGTVTVTPKPVQFELPVWLGGFWEEGRSLAAHYGLPMILGAVTGNSALGELWDHYDARTHREIRAPRVLIRDVYVSAHGNPLDECGEAFARQFDNYREWGLWSGDTSDVAALAADRMIIGTPEQVIEQIRELDEAHGIDHLICRMHFPGMAFPQLVASMTLFGREVMPVFKMPDLPIQILRGV
ncbi:LLM class flavin-dependent oxidoreductase [Microcella alkalica]|uniref:Alkanesulfonate monooxygenase SsuD/methylene tetrahydromethanopterin reductase-like flavin-dependent oxidoreductase (Luciferase family) n=1 Tax=Microcella alkalica TaxID=355930 RepID=A0A839E4N8_9MICO|nr:LLM class flavin-dependent oxidoreductase [Microcella alkalica]MBA8847341.1 alkanesulfonate monooxygenase SsuD/methylene tetrahydromethanopterin reductase-like flavin-dependent oxidoreductase (luciferase family) [Microcella alkalica]